MSQSPEPGQGQVRPLPIPHGLPVDAVKVFINAIYSMGASDIKLQSGDFVWANINRSWQLAAGQRPAASRATGIRTRCVHFERALSSGRSHAQSWKWASPAAPHMKYLTSKLALCLWASLFALIAGIASDLGLLGISIATACIACLATAGALLQYLNTPS